MPGSHWMIVMTPENFEVTRHRGLNVLGLKSRHRKKAERMAPGDRILYYVNGTQVFPATAQVTSTFFEDHRPIWSSVERRPEVFPWRVHTRPDVVLQGHEYIDARQIAPRLQYVKRWAPEDWPLAFQGQVHLLSAADFSLIESEMRRIINRRDGRREQPPRRPREGVPAPTPLPPDTRDGVAPSISPTIGASAGPPISPNDVAGTAPDRTIDL